MTECLKEAVKQIEELKASCIVIKDGKIVSAEQSRGIKPIVSAYESGLLENATVVDKVVGRASAMIMALGGVKECYALTVSEGALAVFLQYGIKVQYNKKTEYIINRTGDGRCPMEEAVEGIDSPHDALLRVKEKLKSLNNK